MKCNGVKARAFIQFCSLGDYTTSQNFKEQKIKIKPDSLDLNFQSEAKTKSCTAQYIEYRHKVTNLGYKMPDK